MLKLLNLWSLDSDTRLA